MSDQNTKRQKTFHDNSKNYRNKKRYLEAGHKGFLATCNFREKECVRECYNILNQYADELYGQVNLTTKTENVPVENNLESDISDDLQREVDATKASSKTTEQRFHCVDTGTVNCVFIKTTLADPVELGTKIIMDIAEKRVQKSRFLLRLIPIEIVCKANLADIMKTAGQIFDKHFLKEGHTFCIVLNKRYNNSIRREDVIRELAEIISQKNVQNKVDLTNPELTVIVEIIKGLCCLSVVEGYFKYKKYNLVELANVNEQQKDETSSNGTAEMNPSEDKISTTSED